MHYKTRCQLLAMMQIAVLSSCYMVTSTSWYAAELTTSAYIWLWALTNS